MPFEYPDTKRNDNSVDAVLDLLTLWTGWISGELVGCGFLFQVISFYNNKLIIVVCSLWTPMATVNSKGTGG